ncbi:hypothetical protein [Shewanella xiamenensis]|nr:hypothetical protein [Shewanella xiamenensis]
MVAPYFDEGAEIIFCNLLFSIVLDTVVLPYRIYKRVTAGCSIILQGLEG